MYGVIHKYLDGTWTTEGDNDGDDDDGGQLMAEKWKLLFVVSEPGDER